MLKTILISLVTLAITSTANGQAQKNWKDRAEFELYAAVQGDGTLASRLQNLDKWKAGYPQSDFADTRLGIYLLTYQQMNNHRAAFDTAVEILKSQPNDLPSLEEIVNHGIQLLPELPYASLSAQNKSDLYTIQKTGRYILENLDVIYAVAKTKMQNSARAATLTQR